MILNLLRIVSFQNWKGFHSKNLKICDIFFQNIDFTPFKFMRPRTIYRSLSTNKLSIFSEKVALHGRMRPGPFYLTRAKRPWVRGWSVDILLRLCTGTSAGTTGMCGGGMTFTSMF